MDNCNCVDVDLVRTIVQQLLWAEMQAGNIQAPLKDCSGVALGAAKVPTCETVENWISTALSTYRVVRHDDSLSGSGTCDSPLTVNKSWLSAFIRTNNDKYGINTSGDSSSGLSGNGSKDKPLALAINHDSSLDGLGTEDSPLVVDRDWLTTFIKEVIDGYGIHTGGSGSDSGLSGNGTTDSPLVLDIQHDASLSGAGTAAAPLKLAIQHGDSLEGTGAEGDPLDVSTSWLKDQITDGNVIVADTTLVSSQVSENGTLPTTIIGGTDRVMGTPVAFVRIADGYALPVYPIATTKAAAAKGAADGV